jgi:hypothetical protein
MGVATAYEGQRVRRLSQPAGFSSNLAPAERALVKDDEHRLRTGGCTHSGFTYELARGSTGAGLEIFITGGVEVADCACLL